MNNISDWDRTVYASYVQNGRDYQATADEFGVSPEEIRQVI